MEAISKSEVVALSHVLTVLGGALGAASLSGDMSFADEIEKAHEALAEFMYERGYDYAWSDGQSRFVPFG
jgi:hypothetical protein